MNGSLAEYAAWLLREDRAGGRNANPALDGEFDLSVDFTGPPFVTTKTPVNSWNVLII